MRIIPDYYIMVERSRAGSVYWKKAGTAGLERTRAGWQEIQAAHESGFSMISCRETTIYEKDRFFSFPSTVKASRVAGSFTVPLYVLSIPVTSWSEMTVGVSAVSSQLHILDSRRGQHPPFWRTFSRICLCHLLSSLWLELSHMTVLGGRGDWGAVFIPGECGPRYMWVLCSGRGRRWILETDSPLPAKVPTEADHAWALCLYPKSSRRLLKCFKKGDTIRFSFRRDHFGSSVGNVFEEGVV